MADLAPELDHLEHFHHQLAEKPVDAQAIFIRNGFLPESAGALIEAGVRCIPLLNNASGPISDAAVGRLAAIVFKVKRVQETAETRRAVDEFETLIQEHKKKDTSNMKFGFALLIGLAVVLGLLAVLLIYLFTR